LADVGTHVEDDIDRLCGKHVAQSADARVIRPIAMEVEAKAIECSANDVFVVGQERCLVHADQ
jgi:hypothetical protein